MTIGELDTHCENCKWYWENCDTENECEGGETVCNEYIPVKSSEQYKNIP